MGETFEEHLDGWYRVPEVWHKNRDLRTFQLWFEFSFHSMIVDVCAMLWNTKNCECGNVTPCVSKPSALLTQAMRDHFGRSLPIQQTSKLASRNEGTTPQKWNFKPSCTLRPD